MMPLSDAERVTMEKRLDVLERRSEASDKRIYALECAFAALADKESKSPVPYETYKPLADEVADFRIALASTEKGWRTIAGAATGLFMWLSGVASVLFGEWAKAHWWSGK